MCNIKNSLATLLFIIQAETFVCYEFGGCSSDNESLNRYDQLKELANEISLNSVYDGVYNYEHSSCKSSGCTINDAFSVSSLESRKIIFENWKQRMNFSSTIHLPNNYITSLKVGGSHLPVGRDRCYEEIAVPFLQSAAGLYVLESNHTLPIVEAIDKGCDDVAVNLLKMGEDVNISTGNSVAPTILHLAAYRGLLSTTQYLVKSMDVNVQYEQGYTPLHLAMMSGKLDVVKELLENGADPNVYYKRMISPMDYAIFTRNLELASLLIYNGAFVEDMHIVNLNSLFDRDTPLHKALEKKDMDEIEILLNNGADLSATNAEGRTALEVAAESSTKDIRQFILTKLINTTVDVQSLFYLATRCGELRLVEELLSKGVEVKGKRNWKYTPLHMAVMAGNKELIQLLISNGADVNAIQKKSGITPLYLAVKLNCLDSIKILLTHSADPNKPNLRTGLRPLHAATSERKIHIMKILFNFSTDANGVDSWYRTPLHYAARSNCLEAIRLLILNAASLIAKDEYGKTPLHEVSIRGNPSTAEVLLVHGADLHGKDHVGSTPLHTATDYDNVDVMKVLLAHGADLNMVDNKGDSPIHIAVYYNYMDAVALLLSNGVSPSAKENLALFNFPMNSYTTQFGHCTKVKNALEIKYAAARGIPVEHRVSEVALIDYEPLLKLHEIVQKKALSDVRTIKKVRKFGFSPFEYAIFLEHEELVKLMINDTNDNNLVNPQEVDWPPLHIATYFGLSSMIELLVNLRADINISDKVGMTALHIAVLIGNLNILRMLIRLNVNVNAQDAIGLTPLQLAVIYHRLEVVEVLIEAGADVGMRDVAGFTTLMWTEAVCISLLIRNFDLNSIERYRKVEYLSEKVFLGDKTKWADEIMQYLKDITIKSEKEKVYRIIAQHADQLSFFTKDYLLDMIKEYKKNNKLQDRIPFKELEYVIDILLQYLKPWHLNLVKVILNHTEDINAQDKILGWSALHWAATCGNLDDVKMLIEKGSHLSPKSKMGQTPMFLARYWGHLDVYSYFRTLGAVW